MKYTDKMSTKVRKCCIKNCTDTVSKRHRFPINDMDLFQAWIKAINHPKFASLSFNQIYKLYYVCNRHFVEHYVASTVKRGLRYDAVPTLYMHDTESSDSYTPVTAEIAIADHNYALTTSHKKQIVNENGTKPEISTLTCRLCLIEITEEVGFHFINEDFILHWKLLDFLPKFDLSLTENPVTCTPCTLMIGNIYQFKQVCLQTENLLKIRSLESPKHDTLPIIKEEISIKDIKEEFFEDTIQTESGYLLVNVDVPNCIEDPISENIYYHCHHCDYATDDKNELTHHVFFHRLRCDECSYTTHDNYSLATHKETHSDTRILRCNICSYTCDEISSLHEHMCAHTGADIFTDKNKHTMFTSSSDEEIDVVSVDGNQNERNNLALALPTNKKKSRTRKRTTQYYYRLNTSLFDERREDNSDSESEVDKRNLHNNLEKQRRIEMRNAFEGLRLVVPEVSRRKEGRTSKIDILKEATFYCYELEGSSVSMERLVLQLRNKQDLLKARVLKLQKELAALY